MPEKTTKVDLTIDLWLLARVRAWASQNKMSLAKAVSFLLDGLNQPTHA